MFSALTSELFHFCLCLLIFCAAVASIFLSAVERGVVLSDKMHTSERMRFDFPKSDINKEKGGSKYGDICLDTSSDKKVLPFRKVYSHSDL